MKKSFFLLSAVFCLAVMLGSARAGETDLHQVLQQYYGGDRSGAVEVLKTLTAQEPKDAALYYYLGYFEQEMGDYGAAREAFRRVYEINPDFLPEVRK